MAGRWSSPTGLIERVSCPRRRNGKAPCSPRVHRFLRSTAGGGQTNCLPRRPHNKARAGSGQPVLPARAFCWRSVVCNCAGGRDVLACVVRLQMGTRLAPGRFWVSRRTVQSCTLRQEVNKDRSLRACLEPRNGSTVFNPAGLCNLVFASRLRPEPLGIASRVALHLWRFSC